MPVGEAIVAAGMTWRDETTLIMPSQLIDTDLWLAGPNCAAMVILAKDSLVKVYKR